MTQQYAALFSHYSANTGEPKPFDTLNEASNYGDRVCRAQPGIQYVLLERDHPDAQWRTRFAGLTIRQAIDHHFGYLS